MWSIALPADTVKSKLQSAKEGTYKGVVDCVRKTMAESGWKGFYHGFGPAMARAVPANVSAGSNRGECVANPLCQAATFLGVELSIKLMNSLF
jgi:solute carrier family 25 carnitine/acylcarnitine transporter 20/29